jgi:PAS domain S-box-containing protein
VRVVRTAPLWLGDTRTGTLMLLWNGTPEVRFEQASLAEVGRHLGLVVGNAELNQKMHREVALRTSLEGSARVGGIVVAQISDTILTVNNDEEITAINPAGERQYGVTAEEVLGRKLGEVIEQLGLDGEPLGTNAAEEARASGYWHGRVIHKPLMGARAGLHLLVDISLTAIHDGRHRRAGLIAMCREVVASDHLQDEAAALSSLAVATSRARNRHEVAEAALERLVEATMADAAMILSWSPEGNVIDASRGLSEETLAVARSAVIPALNSALERSGALVPVEALVQFVAGTAAEAPLLREGLVTGVLVEL